MDLFIDANLAKNLCPQVPEEYKPLLSWLYAKGSLVLTHKINNEYVCGNQTLGVVIANLSRHNRIHFISNEKLKTLKFTRVQERRFKSNKKDRDHLKAIFLSNRKVGLSADKNFIIDVNTYNKVNNIQPFCTDCPTKLDYP